MKDSSEQLQSATTLSELPRSDSYQGIRSVLPGFIKRFLYAFAAVSIISYGLVTYNYSQQQQIRQLSTAHKLNEIITHIRFNFRNVIGDLQFLSKSTQVELYAGGDYTVQRSLERELLQFVNSKGVYDQIRYIDSEGMEKLRVNYNNGHAFVVPVDELQNKSDRYYFSSSMRLKKDEVYISPLDLNIENNQLEFPFKPVIRFGVPVYDLEGKRKGVLLGNFLAKDLLSIFRDGKSSWGDTYSLLNQQGYWLVSENTDNEWGFVVPGRQSLTFAAKHPQVWQSILNQGNGSVDTEQGVFSYVSIFPVALISGLSHERGAEDLVAENDSEYKWIIVAHHDSKLFSTVNFNPAIWGIYILVILSIAASAWFRTRYVQHVRQTFDRLQHDQKYLESQIEARTDELNRSHHQLELLLKSTGEGLFGVDTDGRCTFANNACLKLLGYADQTEVIGKDTHELMHHSHADGSPYHEDECPIFMAFRDGIGIYRDDDVFWRKDGSSFAVEYRSFPLTQHDSVMGAVVTFNDITQRKQTEERISILSQAIEQSPVAVVITDPDVRIQYVNSAFETITGYKLSEVQGKNPSVLNSGKTERKTYQELWQTLISGKSWVGIFQNRKKNGDCFMERAHIAPVMNEDGEISHFLGVLEDITSKQEQEQRIWHQAHFDSLTDLPNRFLSLDRLEQMINGAKRNEKHIAVLFLDLDDFKKINDTLGHEVGDRILVQAAERLQGNIREGDTVGRLGGDEFIILIDDLEYPAQAQVMAENMLEHFREPFRMDDRELILTASIGISVYPGDGWSAVELLRNADSAMYFSKSQGRNTLNFFTQAMHKDVFQRLELEEQLHGALVRNEFKLMYQPLVDIASRRIAGVEVLLRWNNPVLGDVPPEKFIPIAEQTGLIVSIGEYVLNTALKVAQQWQPPAGKYFRVAINLSPQQFRDPKLFEVVENALVQSGIASGALELEITEGVLMTGHNFVHGVLRSLSELGVGIAMDDFGTGYSSLNYLRNYPFDTMKIDKQFISEITTNAADLKLVVAAITMAQGLGLSVVAEGIETEQQLNLLAEHGCEIGQGYYFSKPVESWKITEMLENMG